MKVRLTIETTLDVDPEKLRDQMNTEGLSASEATKVLKDRIFRDLDSGYSEYGRYGDYSREIRDEIKEVAKNLGVLSDNSVPTLNVSRPQEG